MRTPGAECAEHPYERGVRRHRLLLPRMPARLCVRRARIRRQDRCERHQGRQRPLLRGLRADGRDARPLRPGHHRSGRGDPHRHRRPALLGRRRGPHRRAPRSDGHGMPGGALRLCTGRAVRARNRPGPRR
ncbi:hypothetical protein LT493_23810 [Streptomyces tricolor]|nr:hypothetical protein [Streptomyces tricolor]